MTARLFFLTLFLAAGTNAPAADDFATTMVEATHKLFHDKSTGTCFLVRSGDAGGPVYIATAAHSFERMTGDSALLVLRERLEDGSYRRHDHKVLVRQGETPLWVRHPEQDVAVLRLADKPAVPIAPLPLDAIATEEQTAAIGLHPGSPFLVLTYPQRFEPNPSGFPTTRQAGLASHPLLPIDAYPLFLGDFTAFAGDSGGPAFVDAGDGNPRVIGMVVSQFRHDEKLTMEYEERMIHHPLGLGGIVHARFVRETIEKAEKEVAPSE